MSNLDNDSYLTHSSPLSLFCRIPVLAGDRPGVADLLKSIRFFSDKPAVLSNSLGVPTLAKDVTFSKLLGLPTSIGQSQTLTKIWKSFNR